MRIRDPPEIAPDLASGRGYRWRVPRRTGAAPDAPEAAALPRPGARRAADALSSAARTFSEAEPCGRPSRHHNAGSVSATDADRTCPSVKERSNECDTC